MKNIRKKIISSAVLCVTVLTLIFPGLSLAAEEVEEIEKNQIIFLLDASKSMEKDEQWISAVDSALLISSSLPENYETALLAYNTDIAYGLKFGEVNADKREELVNLEMQGYTDPAVALFDALDLYGEEDGEKRVIFISDGEISMKEEEQTKRAEMDFEDAVNRAVTQGVKIDMFILPDEKTQNQILYGSEITSGSLYSKTADETLEHMAVSYLFESLALNRIELGMSHTDIGNISVDLQDSYMQNAKIVFDTEFDIENVHVSGQCEQLNITQGNKFAVAELTNPLETSISVDYTLSERGGVHAYLIKEYELQSTAKSTYLQDQDAFQIEVNIVNHKNKNFLDADNTSSATNILIDGQTTGYEVNNGTAVINIPADESKNITLDIDFTGNNSMIHCDELVHQLKLTVPVIEEEPDYTVLWIVLIALCIVILFLTIFYERKKQKKKLEEDIEKLEKEEMNIIGYELSGQVTIYLLKGGGEDVPPYSIKLFGKGKKMFSFNWMKDRCDLQLHLIDDDKIKFSGGKNHTLCLKNTGCATVVKGNEILLQDKKYYLNYGEKILLIFNDGEVEAELHYKNIKPSER